MCTDSLRFLCSTSDSRFRQDRHFVTNRSPNRPDPKPSLDARDGSIMIKHKTLRFLWITFPLNLPILLLPVMPGLAERAAGKADSIDNWTSGPNLPTFLIRAVGVFFQPNGRFYCVGGRTSDLPGSETINPFEYNPVTNTWTTSTAAYPDSLVDNMACGALTVTGTTRIYCVGGSFASGVAATARVFSYDPVIDTITSLTAVDNWPGDAAGTILPGGFIVVANKLYIIGGFNISNGMTTHQTWVFDPSAPVGSRWTQKADYPVDRGYIPTAAIGNAIYTAGGSLGDGATIHDTNDSYKYNIATDTWTAIANIPRLTAETRALNVYGQMWVMGGGRDAPNPSNEVDIYDPYCNSWTIGAPFVTPRRNFPTDANGGSRVWLAGGYVNSVPDMTMEIYQAPLAISAVSRKVHGGAGTFDVTLPLNGPTGVECRTGPTYQMVVTFSTNVTVGDAAVTCGTGSVDSFSGKGTPTITVNLAGVTDVQRITVTLSNVNDGFNVGDVPVSMGVLVGDVNGNGAVNATDVALTKSQVGQPVGSGNFREDVNANGTISSTDVAIVKSDVGTSLPP
jgi:hypothetical protein